MEVNEKVREQFLDVIVGLSADWANTVPDFDLRTQKDGFEKAVLSAVVAAVDRLMAITETYYSIPSGLTELRGYMEKCSFAFSDSKPFISITVSVAKSPENLMALASIGDSVTIRGCQLDIEAVQEQDGQLDIEKDLAPEQEEPTPEAEPLPDTIPFDECERIDVPMPKNSATVTIYIKEADGMVFAGYNIKLASGKAGDAVGWTEPVFTNNFWPTRDEAVHAMLDNLIDFIRDTQGPCASRARKALDQIREGAAV